jgi:hypothetical protein
LTEVSEPDGCYQGIPADSLSDTGCGRLQVRFDGEWGEVCGDGWGSADARVVCGMLGLSGGTAGGGSGDVLPADTVFWMHNVDCSGDETDLRSCTSGRAATAEQGRGVCPTRNGARVCCVSAEQEYYAQAFGDGDDDDTVETLTSVQDDAQSFAADIRDALEFAKEKLDAAEDMKDLVDKVMGEKSEKHGVKSTETVAKMKHQFGGAVNAKSVKPLAKSAVKCAVKAINIFAPEVAIVMDVAIGFFDALDNFIQTGSLISAAATFVTSMVSNLPVIGDIWGVLTSFADDSDSEGKSTSMVTNPPVSNVFQTEIPNFDNKCMFEIPPRSFALIADGRI